MKVVYHPDFREVYTGDPAAVAGRLEPMVAAIEGIHELVEPVPASEDQALRVHDPAHLAALRRRPGIHRMALLAAGATIEAALLGATGEPAFALARPPGHHASPGSAWGFCFLNNVAIAVEELLAEGLVRSALILDIDLHHGDGTEAAFAGRDEVTYLHPEGPRRDAWLAACRGQLESAEPRDVVAVSAGFDRHVEDWGGLLETEDYRTVGGWVRDLAARSSRGRRFGVLEGGYNAHSMAHALTALLDGLG